MKLAERAFHQDGKMIVQERHDFNATLEKAATMRSMGMTGQGENRVIGVVPQVVVREWAKKHGVSLADHDAMSEVIDKELADPDNALFRVWGGTY